MSLTLSNRMTLLFSALGAIVTVQIVFPLMAHAVIKPDCDIANQLGKVSDPLASKAMGVAYKLGTPILIVLLVVLVFTLNQAKSKGIMGSAFRIFGVILALGLVVGIYNNVVNPPC